MPPAAQIRVKKNQFFCENFTKIFVIFKYFRKEIFVKFSRKYKKKFFVSTLCEISKEMSSLYFGLVVFCLFEARVPESDT